MEAPNSSAATRNSQACANARRSPDTTDGSTAGSWTVVKSLTPRYPKARAASTSLGFTCASAAETVVYTGKNAPIATSVTLEFSPMPIHNSSNGTQASEGTARNAPMVGAAAMRAGPHSPIIAPRNSPSTAPMLNPSTTRWVEITRWVASSPRWANSVPAAMTRVGEGSCTAVNTPAVLSTYHSVMSAAGRISPT